MLKGDNVNLRMMEKNDIPLTHQWHNNLEVSGLYNGVHQYTQTKAEQHFTEAESDPQNTRHSFLIELKDGTKVGSIGAWKDRSGYYTMGASILPEFRRQGYCSEATMLMIDYLFLSDIIERVQALANVDNVGSRKTLQKAGLKEEGVLRKFAFVYGKWCDFVMLSILREEWNHPRVLKLPKN
ncbi:MAG: N-acetyltransferase [Promethearchaeota archaeon]|nr:MAG: N-acetyltransferase [Candidatus Lokiarchaeota archaeon]